MFPSILSTNAPKQQSRIHRAPPFASAKARRRAILSLTKLAGADLEKAKQTVNSLASQGYRTIGVAVARSSDNWAFLGILPLLDPPRPDSKSTIARARA